MFIKLTDFEGDEVILNHDRIFAVRSADKYNKGNTRIYCDSENYICVRESVAEVKEIIASAEICKWGCISGKNMEIHL